MTILPNCNRCGQCGCECGALPYTMTVTLSGLQNKAHTEHCALTISSNFGTGASAIAMTPGGDSKGPLSSVLVLEGGCGYAKLGHVEPTLVISGGGGTGATFTPTLAPVDATVSEPCRTWKLASVTMTGGTGYSVGDKLTITSTDNTIEISPALATVAGARVEPAVTATVAGGNGAVLAVTLASNNDDPETWGVDSVAVENGGAGYTSGTAVTFATSDTKVVEAEASIVTKLAEPVLSAGFYNNFVGSGATFGTPTFTVDTSGAYGPATVWKPTSIPVTAAGSGYYVGVGIKLTVIDGTEISPGSYSVTSVDANGGVLTAGVSNPGFEGVYYRDTHVIDSVAVSNHGQYYGESGTPGLIAITNNGGEYYRESETVTPCVANVTVTNGCWGGGGSLSPVIDTTVGSPTFGTLTGVTINDGGGTNNLFSAWHWQDTHQESLNGVPLVLVAGSPKKLVTLTFDACYGDGACAVVNAVGDRVEPTLKLFAACRLDAANNYDPASCAPCQDGTVTATLSQHTDDEGRPYWSVASASASGGTGYPASLAAQVEQGNPCLEGDLPSVTVTAAEGVLTGATVDDGGQFWWQLNYDGQPGPIREVEVISGGSGYARLGREQPTLLISGGNATFTPALSQHTDGCGLDYWRIDSVEVTGGTGYANGQSLTVELATEDDHEEQAAVLSVQASESGVPSAVTVATPGRYYRENAALPPYVADVSVVLTQMAPSDGSGAEFSVVVEDDTASPAFGSILAIHVTAGGSGYQILGAPHDCSYGLDVCRDDHNFQLSLAFRGRNRTPILAVREYLAGIFLREVAVLEGDDPLTDCASPPSSASLLYGAESGSASISPGGAVATDCEPTGYCGGNANCNVLSGCPTILWNVEVTVSNNAGAGLVFPGTYSFSGSGLDALQQRVDNQSGFAGILYDPNDTRMMRFPVSDGIGGSNVCEGFQDWPEIYPYGYHYTRLGYCLQVIRCFGDRIYFYAAAHTQFCGLFDSFTVGVAYTENDIMAHGLVPVEWVNGVMRIKAGTHNFQYPTRPMNAGGTFRMTLTLSVSY